MFSTQTQRKKLKSPVNLPLPVKLPSLLSDGVRKDSDKKAMSGPHHPGIDPHTPQGEVRWGKCLGRSQTYLGPRHELAQCAGRGPACKAPPACLGATPALLCPPQPAPPSKRSWGVPRTHEPWKSGSYLLVTIPKGPLSLCRCRKSPGLKAWLLSQETWQCLQPPSLPPHNGYNDEAAWWQMTTRWGDG